MTAPTRTDDASAALVAELLLATPAQARDVFSVLRLSDIHGAELRAVAEAVQDVLERDNALDVVLVRDELLRRNGRPQAEIRDLLGRLLPRAVSPANLRLHAKVVAREAADVARADAAGRLAAAREPQDKALARSQLEAAEARLAQIEAWEDPANPTAPATLNTKSLAEILALPVVEPDWFVPGLLGRKRLTLLTAAPKTGKSAAAYGIALKLASGLAGTWLGTDFGASIGLRVLYLSAEGGLRLIQQRYELLADGLPGGFHNDFRLLVERPWPRLDAPEGLNILRATLTAQPADILIIDPLARFRDLEGENDNAISQRFAENLRSVADDHNLAVLLVHHPSKAGGTDREATSFYGGRGASALFGEVDAAISLRREPKSGEIHAYFELRDAEPIEPGRRLRLNPDNLWLDFEGPLGSGDGGKARAVEPHDVLAALKEHPDGYPWGQVHKIVGCSRASWFRYRADVLTSLAGKIRLEDGTAYPVHP